MKLEVTLYDYRGKPLEATSIDMVVSRIAHIVESDPEIFNRVKTKITAIVTHHSDSKDKNQ